MGMYDSFFLNTKCPYCGEECVREFQTKKFASCLNAWKEGDMFVEDSIEIISGEITDLIGGCNSKKCDAWQVKKDGYKSGFGRLFYCDVVIKDSKVEKAINIRKKR